MPDRRHRQRQRRRKPARVPHVIWHSRRVYGERLRQVEAELRHLLETGLAKPADLIFHTVFLGDDWARGPQVMVWGQRFSPYFHAEFYPGAAQ